MIISISASPTVSSRPINPFAACKPLTFCTPDNNKCATSRANGTIAPGGRIANGSFPMQDCMVGFELFEANVEGTCVTIIMKVLNNSARDAPQYSLSFGDSAGLPVRMSSSVSASNAVTSYRLVASATTGPGPNPIIPV